jgi:hypothetical protein
VFLAKTIYLYLRWQLFFIKQSWTNSFNLSFSFECGNSCVEGRDIINTYFIRFQSYCDTSYSRGSVNQMWILKLFTDMLGYIQPWPFSSCNSIRILISLPSTQLFPHSKLKDYILHMQVFSNIATYEWIHKGKTKIISFS